MRWRLETTGCGGMSLWSPVSPSPVANNGANATALSVILNFDKLRYTVRGWNQFEDQMSELVEGLKREHNKYRRYLALFENQINKMERDGQFDYDIIDTLLEYFLLYPDQWHHKKEDVIYDEVIGDDDPTSLALYNLHAEHEMLEAAIRSFGERVEHLRIGQDVPASLLVKEGARYLRLIREHMAREEEWFFPAAEHRLSPDQWRRIEDKINQTLGPQRASSPVLKELKRLESEIDRLCVEAE